MNSSGKVTAQKAGKADIVVKSSNGKKAVCKVTVYQPKLKSIKLNKNSIHLVEGDKTSIKYTLNPDGAVGKVKWKSSNSKVVSVDSKGNIRAKKGGTAKVTAYVTSKIKADCTINVKSKASSIKLNKSDITVSGGDQYQLTYTLYPQNLVGNVTWSSNRPDIASVDSNGLVTAKSHGTAVITAQVSSNVKQTCKVTVPVSAESIKFDSDLIFMDKEETIWIKAQIAPLNCEEKAEWKSSNPEIAVIEGPASGLAVRVRGVKAGKAKLTISVGRKSAVCEVEVMDGAWADISKGSIHLFDNSAMQFETGGKNYHFHDQPFTLMIVQSTPVTDNYIKIEPFPGSVDCHIILAGVNMKRHAAPITIGNNSNVIIELKEGTENYLESDFSGIEKESKSGRLEICGKGSLSVLSQKEPAIGHWWMEVADIHISGGNLNLHTNESSTPVIGSNGLTSSCTNITIGPDAHVEASGGCKAVGTQGDGSESDIEIADGSLIWTP